MPAIALRIALTADTGPLHQQPSLLLPTANFATRDQAHATCAAASASATFFFQLLNAHGLVSSLRGMLAQELQQCSLSLIGCSACNVQRFKYVPVGKEQLEAHA